MSTPADKPRKTHPASIGGPPVSHYPLKAFSRLPKEVTTEKLWELIGPTVEKNLGTVPLWKVFAVVYYEGMQHGVEGLREIQERESKMSVPVQTAEPGKTTTYRHLETGRLYDELLGITHQLPDLVCLRDLQTGFQSTHFRSELTMNFELVSQPLTTNPKPKYRAVLVCMTCSGVTSMGISEHAPTCPEFGK